MDKLQKATSGLPVQENTKKILASALSENTLRGYRGCLAALSSWLGDRSLDDVLLAEYLTHLHEVGRSPGTIAKVVSAVRWRAKYSGNSDLELTLTNGVLAGIRREGKDRGRGQVDGLTWAQVERVCAFAESDRTVAGLRDSAMIRLMSDCLLRVAEVVAVDISDFEKQTLLIRKSKTDQTGIGESLYVGEDTRKILTRYRTGASITEGALFRRIRRGDHIQRQRLTCQSARQIIVKRANAAGFDGFISGHSLRVGSAVSLAQAGASVVNMQEAGRWKSPQMPAHYARAELAERGAIARYKYGKSG
ncbi:tyrosine-type recombinase/integrase [Candidatus Poribacteria bacterium]|nr:tyrosine-type recombinase/integrase [Candidatus Poribacteria bacterium]MYB66013.1 tyrosine-type recombinase/integrase [Candidatus Poribacteria bacterium]